MFEKWILYTFIRGAVMYVYFEFTVPSLLTVRFKFLK
jgi:hypothetical protein